MAAGSRLPTVNHRFFSFCTFSDTPYQFFRTSISYRPSALGAAMPYYLMTAMTTNQGVTRNFLSEGS